MSEEIKDNKDYEFIQEQVIQKKNKRYKKWFLQFLSTILMAVLFGVVAAVTFCVTEPALYNKLHKEEKEKTPITFPTVIPEDDNNIEDNVPTITPIVTPDGQTNDDNGDNGENQDIVDGLTTNNDNQKNEAKVIYQSIDADVDDFKKIYNDIRNIANKSSKSLVTVSGIVEGKDVFGNPTEKKTTTCGLVVADANEELTIVVSLDRIKDASKVKLELSATEYAEAELLAYDEDLNLAIVTVKLENIHKMYLTSIGVAKLGESYTVTVGNPVLALGCPNGYQGSMDIGIITSRDSAINIVDNKIELFNTNMQFSDNGDGVIINMQGEVVGLITRTLKEGNNKKLSTAIGISKIRPIILSMANQTPRIYFGIVAEDMTKEAWQVYSINNGIYINEVRSDSPAFTAGLKSGDIILKIDDKDINSVYNFNTVLSGYKPGDKVEITIKRTSGTDKDMKLSVVLAEKN